MEIKSNKLKKLTESKIIDVFMIIETVIMLPCFITTVTGEYLGKNLGDIILILETVPFLIFAFFLIISIIGFFSAYKVFYGAMSV